MQNRNLFKATQNINENYASSHQYSRQSIPLGTPENLNNSEDNVSFLNNSSLHNDSLESPLSVKTLPLMTNNCREESWPLNLSAPAVLTEDEEGFTSFNISSGDSDSELECLFKEDSLSPTHTSTPKSQKLKAENYSLRRTFAMTLFKTHHQNER